MTIRTAAVALILCACACACAEPPPPTVAVAPEQPRPSVEAAPPPPPPSGPSASGPSASAPSPPTAPDGSAPKALCDAVCRGQSTPDLESALQLRARQAHRCYDNALVNDRKLEGKVAIEVWISPDGAVCSSKVASAAKGMEPVAECVRGYFASQSYPAPAGACVSVKVPISFLPKK